MSDTTYLRLIAEMLTVETVAERRAIWDREQHGWQEFIADRSRATVERDKRARAWLSSLSWWQRIGKHEWDMPNGWTDQHSSGTG